MSADVFAALLGHGPGVAAAVAAALAVNASASVVRVWIEQTFRTRRLARALEGVEPDQRADIILACGRLEAGLSRSARDKHLPVR